MYQCSNILPVLVGLILAQLTGLSNAAVSCKNEAGHNVDWFYMYKLPQHYKNATASINSSGLQYMYFTNENSDGWQWSKTHINSSESMTALTLNPLLSNSSVLFIAYNDEFPNGTTIATGGHTKGVVATDGETGIWLIHSVPKFPAVPNYSYPTTGARYAQSLLCLTLNADEMNKIGNQLLYNEAHVYYSHIPDILVLKYPTLDEVVQHKWRVQAPYYNELSIKTLAGDDFRSFAKSSKFEKELYSDWVATTLDASLLVETWRNGAGNLESNCTADDKVYNIAEINETEFNAAFKSTSDHSKWAVSEERGFRAWRWRFFGSDWICVGDINRQKHQLKRGGGTVCQKSVFATHLYRKLIAGFDKCVATNN